MTESARDGTHWRHRGGVILLWSVPFLALIVWVIARLGIFPLTTRVLVDTVQIEIPRAYYTVDHPFHTARAGLIARAWETFESVRWVGSHQGGYPAEFFPFGVPGFAALISLLSGGWLAIESAWAITIATLFLLPLVGYWLLARHNGSSPAVVLIAFAAHVAIASDWMHGGYSELVEWGLATNVAGATYALIALPLLLRAAEDRSVRWIAASAALIALCAVSNPRSLIAVAVIALAVLAQRAIVGHVRRALVRVAAVALLAIGLSAPVIVPLLRYNDLYFFLSYQEYGSVTEYLRATIDAVTWPVLIAAIAGCGFAFRRQKESAAQAGAITLVGYMALTALAAALPGLRELVPQLELPRLMPFQRLLTFYLAAYGVMRLVELIPVPVRRSTWRDAGAAVAVSAVLLVVFTTCMGPLTAQEQGLRDVPKTDGADGVELLEFRAAVEEADASAMPDEAILVLGSRLSWHEQLWAPMADPDRRFLYNDWLWYWHTEHAGPYDYRSGHFYPNPSDALDADYLATHGIGAVVVTDVANARDGANVRSIAAADPDLERVTTVGAWDVYRVASSVGIATLAGAVPERVSVAQDFERISLTFENAEAGTLLIRQNWFPRWTATLNGAETPVERGESGYMEIEVDEGPLEVELTYGVTTTDAIARWATMASAVTCVVLVLGAKPISRWARR